MSERHRLELLTGFNVIVQLEHLTTHPSVARALKQGRITRRGWVYRIHDGEVRQLDPATGRFHSRP